MTWSYSQDPTQSTRDAVRFLVGDTDENDPQLQNEEIDYLITKYVVAELAATQAARTLAARYSRYADRVIGELRISYSQRAANYRELVITLTELASTAGGVPRPYAGGIRVSDKDVDEADTDVPGRFRMGMHDLSGATTEDELLGE
ncbi:MAG: hypothetical protein ACRD2A_13325 [Vicinamibacterales bacterium]